MARNETRSIVDELPVDRLMAEALGFGKAMARHGFDRLGGGVDAVTSKLGDVGSGPGVSDVAKGAGRMVKDKNPVKGGAHVVKGGTEAVKGGTKSVAGGVAGGTKAAATKVKDSVGGAVDAVTPSGKPSGKSGGKSGDKSKGKSGGKSNAEPDLKVTNIVESVDVPVSREVAYREWTRFEEFPTFMKKVENVSQEDDDVVTWKAQIFWSHRTWKARIIDQVPPERIVWKSEGDKGHVDGAVTFHELAPDLTRVLVTLEYHPQGLFEHTGNLWHAQGRRVRVELKHFRRHISTSTLLHPDEVQGWTGEIHDGDVKKGSAKKSTAKKTTPAKRSTAKKTTSKKTGPAKKTTARKSTAKKTTPAKKTTAKKTTPAKKTTAKRTTAKKTTPARKSTAKKTTPARKSTARKTTPARKSTARKSTAKKATAKKSASSPRKRQTARSGS